MSLFEYLEEDLENWEPMDPEQTAIEADNYTQEESDQYITAEAISPCRGKSAHAVVKTCVHDEDTKAIRKYNNNTQLYEVEFADSSTETLSTNLIAENLYAEVDAEGNSHTILKQIIGHS